MKTGLGLLGLLLVLALACPAARANYTYALDTGVNSGNIEWDSDRYTASLQVFPTNALGTVIDQLIVAWGNQTGDAHVLLYSLDNGYQLPKGGGVPVDQSQFHVLQSLDTTVTSLQTNAFTGTQTNPTWTTYSITPTTITTNYFAVGTIQRVIDPYNYASNTMDMSVDLLHDGSNGYSWFATNLGSLNDNLSNACTSDNGAGNDDTWVQQYGWAGYGNNPFLLNAVAEAPVPEPITMTSVFLGLVGLGGWVRRRMARPQA
jgi:hypothetical protein